MTRILIACSRQAGFVLSLSRIAAGFVKRGDEVYFLSGEEHRDTVIASGATYLRVPWDASEPAAAPVRPTGGTAVGRFERLLREVFVAAAEREFHEVQRRVRELSIDAIVVEPTFLGGQIYGYLPRATRPAVITAGVTALPLPSRDTAPFGMGLHPLEGPANRIRNGVLNFAVDHVLSRRLKAEFTSEITRLTGVRPHSRTLVGLIECVDVWAQCTVSQFEYPRSDLPRIVRFVGPLLSPPFGDLPADWDWSDRRPIVHVTQGTFANGDLTELIAPTIRALAEDRVLVVASTGGRPVGDVQREYGGRLPDNVRVAEFLPYDQLLAATRVMVTNGGAGSVHSALRYGVPLVVSGTTEDRPETNARVAWSGAGIDLRQRHADPDRIRDAVRTVMRDPSFQQAASRLGAAIASTDAIASIAAIVDEAVATASRR